MPKVTIVLPTYNGEKYIRESISSILNQSFTDWELIIVDDCSTDHTPDIIKEYEDRDKRIKVIHNETNQKLPKSLNIGFAQAKGEYLTWTSDDNYYLPEAIEKMNLFLDENSDIQFVCADMNIIDESGNEIGVTRSYDSEKVCLNNCVGACFMYKREVLQKLDGYDPEMFLVEDYEYWLRILSHYGEIGHIKNVYYLYRNHDESLSRKKRLQVRRNLAILRKKYLNMILCNLKSRKEYLCQVYYELKEMDECTEELVRKFFLYVPEIQLDTGSHPYLNKKIIVYGAGDFGNLAYEKYGNRIAYYADRDFNKVGQYKNGIRIISIDDMVEKASDHQILIAVHTQSIYEMLKTLDEKHIEKCCVFLPDSEQETRYVHE